MVAGWKSSELGRFTMFRHPTGILFGGLERQKDGMNVPLRLVPCSRAGDGVGLYPVGLVGSVPQPVSACFGIGPDPEQVVDPVRRPVDASGGSKGLSGVSEQMNHI